MQEIRLATQTVRAHAPGPHLLVTGGVHGDEFEPMVAIRRLVSDCEALERSGELAGSVTFVPVVNEPAFARRLRTAEDGLDLARVCPGRPDGSITERIADALSVLIRDADFYIDLHTGGTAFQVMPLAGYCLHPESAVLDKQREMARAFNLPIVWGTTANLSGRSLSVARDAGVPAIYAEYMGGGGCTSEGVRAYVDGCLNVMGLFGIIDRTQPRSAIRHRIEDDRPSAGHMQIRNPAPIAGYFEPCVELGGRVQAGEPLGTVCDALADAVEPALSMETGLVLVLRTFPRVDKGDALAVVLELDSPAVTVLSP